MRQRSVAPNLVVALDQCSPEQALEHAERLGAVGVKWFKVGLELFTAAGPELVKTLKKQGFSVFLDLKLHDIPTTVAKAVESAAKTKADMLTVHAQGGAAMLAAAARAGEQTGMAIVAVTVLTSLSDTDLAGLASAWGGRATSAELTERLSKLSLDSGVHGLVLPAPKLATAHFLKKYPGRLFVTPGIRSSSAISAGNTQDQVHVATAFDAVCAGSTHLVVGRPILGASDPCLAAKEFINEINRVKAV